MISYFGINELASYISHTYGSFAGHRIACDCANVRIFDALMRTADYLRKEKAAVACNFTALRRNSSAEEITLCITLLDEENIYSPRAFSIQEVI